MRGFSDHFSAVAGPYARHRPDYPPALFDHLAQLCSGEPRTLRAWDCATGSGQAAVALAGRLGRVLASDASPAQLAAMHRGAPPKGAPPRGGGRLLAFGCLAEDSALADASVDLITVAQALHWFDIEAFWAEVRRVLRPGGLVAVWCYQLLTVTPAVDRVVRRYYHRVVGPYWPPERRHVEAGYRGLPFPFEEEPWPAMEAVHRWRLEDLLGYLGTWSAAERYREARGEDPREEIAGELRRAWGEPRQRPARFPLSGRIGRR